MGIARSLRYEARKYFQAISPDSHITVGKLEYDFPYSGIEFAPYDQPLPPEVYENYESLRRIFDPQTISKEWLEFMKESTRERKTKGLSDPIDLALGLHFLLEESPLARARGLRKLDRLKIGDPDYRNSTMIIETVNNLSADTALRAELKKVLGTLALDVSRSSVSMDRVKRVLDKLGITDGIVVDLGCGIGDETVEWAKTLRHKIIGVERQYHPEWYNPFWKAESINGPRPIFIRGDFISGIPLRDKSIDAVLVQNVAQHITQKALQTLLKESLRILKNGGIIFVGPEHTKSITSWRIFRKVPAENADGYYLRECRYYDLMPEDKPKPWRRRRKSGPQNVWSKSS